MNSAVKIGGTLFAFSAIAALLLAGTNQITSPIIEQLNIKSNNEARMEVIPQAKDFKEVAADKYKEANPTTVSEVYEAADGSNTVGYTVKVNPSGYGGTVEVTVGISTEGKITGVKIGNNSETPGLGAKSQEPEFYEQYKGKDAKTLEVVKSGSAGENQIKAISGATITSNAVTSGVNEAIQVFDVLNK